MRPGEFAAPERCSFCDRTPAQAGSLWAGHRGARVCPECVRRLVALAPEDKRFLADPEARPRPLSTRPSAVTHGLAVAMVAVMARLFALVVVCQMGVWRLVAAVTEYERALPNGQPTFLSMLSPAATRGLAVAMITVIALLLALVVAFPRSVLP